MGKFGICVCAITTLSACGDSTSPTLPSDVGVAGDGTLASVLDFIRADNTLPALAAALIRGDQIVETAAVGVRAEGFPEEVTTDDQWHIGSLTKSMTATLAAVLVERGVLDWTTTVAQVFPDFVGTIRPEYEGVRLDELLYHTAGLPVDIDQAASWPTSRSDPRPLPVQRRQLANDLLVLAPDVTRGTHLYTNAGYMVAGSMIEEVTGEQWESLMQRELFTPLQMTSTGFGAPGSAGARDQPWGHQPTGSEWMPVEPGLNADNPASIGPAGTVHSTMSDYARYMMAHLAGARGVDGLVSATTFTKLHTSAPGAGAGYALGWGTSERGWANGRTLQHSGSNTLWYAVVWIAPERDLAMFAVTNAPGNEGARGTDGVVQALIQRFDAAFP